METKIVINAMGVEVTRPDQDLIIMRGIPGSGKSTESKKRLADGIIHSTDDLIEATGDYAGHFAKMVESGNWSAHSKMHNQNFKNAKLSMERGITPVIVDNTNIKANEPKDYVEAALKMGFSDENITFVEVGAGGCTAEELAERNTHNVGLETIERMLTSYNSVGPMTVKKVLKAKSMHSTPKIAFIKLDAKSKDKLMTALGHKVPKGWLLHGHHMTIGFGKTIPKELKAEIGTKVTLKAVTLGVSDMAIAVGVEGFMSANEKPHITLGVNPEGKPVMSNKITDWKELVSYMNLTGEVMQTTPFVSPTTVKS